jgi:hypothetical protein
LLDNLKLLGFRPKRCEFGLWGGMWFWAILQDVKVEREVAFAMEQVVNEGMDNILLPGLGV